MGRTFAVHMANPGSPALPGVISKSLVRSNLGAPPGVVQEGKKKKKN